MPHILQILPLTTGFLFFSLVGLAGQGIWSKRLFKLTSGSVLIGPVQSVEQASCSIYVLDPARDLGMPACNYADPAVWPHALKVTGLLGGTEPLQHWEYQQAVQFWLEQAIIDNGARADRLASADLIYVNMHCYETWRAGKWWQVFREKVLDGADPELYMQQTMNHLSASPFIITSEHTMFCEQSLDAHARQGLILPYVTDTHQEGFDPLATTRDTLLFYRGGCAPPPNDPAALHFASGKLLRRALVDTIQASPAPDLDVQCACDLCPGALPHAEVLARMRDSRFCLVLAGDKPSSRRGSEAALSGCVPVLVGPPWHTVALADDIDHGASSVFVSVRRADWVVANASLGVPDNHPDVLNSWYLDAHLVPSSVIQVDSLAEVLGVLRGMPPEVLAAKQAALARQAYRQYWLPPPGETRSQLGEIVVKRLCDHAQMLKDRDIIPPHPIPHRRRTLLAD
ncbi:hypothetical protein F751_0902 [Auxenochlorella protothecoides]|uniref:Exostosin GT47 domain-containing protein n=1 Tax=Auxenochlorella protothecoides TaxID=3075 RepID=A0A087SI10_AUXPR|nr:hypothetical protein F751_0902 [Auxenochlorella protothecoides]KFM25364.1 hypothetical protein F751_0902 [Auxenochlorella protothecoides]